MAFAGVFTPQHSLALSTISTSEIQPGMKGYGLTVFSGSEPERFEVEVVSVVPNFLLRQDIILIRCIHPITDKAGVIGGMSGSPIFIEGKLAGALAYGWNFNKEPIAGVTAIDDMLAVLKRQPRGDDLGRFGRLARMITEPFTHSRDRVSHRGERYFGQFDRGDSGQLVPAHTPLTLGGFFGGARKILEGALAKYGMIPVVGGGTTGKMDGPKNFVSGGAIGVQLIRGDMSATAIGTVTMVKDKNVLAFGHPMFNMGEGYLPVTTAHIHTVISSYKRSNKLGSPLVVAGSLVQDRNACIVARTDKRAEMIPVKVTIRDDRSRRQNTYQVEIALHRLFTHRFLHASLVNIITNAASDKTDVVAELTGTIKIAGMPPVTIYDSGASRAGLAPLAGYFRPVDLVESVLNNPFEDTAITSLEFDIKLHYGLELASIVGAYLTAENPEPGEIVNVHVRLQKYGGGEQIMTIPLRIPQVAPGQKIQVEVGGGDYMTPVMPAPQNLRDMVTNVTRYYPPKSLVVGINLPGEGVALRGRVIEQLPASAVAALRPSVGQDQISWHRTTIRKVTSTSSLIRGQVTIPVTVGGLKSK